MSAPSPMERTWLDVVPVAATASVALAAAVLAADASREVAVASGAVSNPALAWCVPVIIEGGSVTSGLLAWRRSRMRQPARPERLTLLVLVLLAVVVNAAHAASSSPLGWVIAAAPPLVLVVSVELLLRNRAAAHDVSAAVVEREREEERRRLEAEQKAERLREQRARTAARRAAEPGKPSSQKSGREPSPTGRPSSDRAAIRKLIDERVPLTGPDVEARFDKKASTARRLLREARVSAVREWLDDDPGLTPAEVAERLLVSEKEASGLLESVPEEVSVAQAEHLRVVAAHLPSEALQGRPEAPH